MATVDALVPRPAYGKRGKPVMAVANYWGVSLPDITVHQYDVKISPELDTKYMSKAKTIWDRFEQQYLPGCYAVYDGRSLVYSPGALPFGASVRHTVVYREAGPRYSEECYQVTLCKTDLVSKLRSLSDFVQGKVPKTVDTIATMQCLNILFNVTNNPKFLKIRESFFTHDNFAKLTGGLELYKGIFQSVRLGIQKVLLNVDTAVTVMHARGTLISLCIKFLNLRDETDLCNLDPQRYRLVLKVVTGLRVFWTHRGERGRTKDVKMKGLTTNGANREMFTLNANQSDTPDEQISVADYFLRNYNIRLKYPSMPCVIVGKDARMPMEVCELVMGQRFTKVLGPLQVAEVIKTTCIRPGDRLRSIELGVRAFNYEENAHLKAWGLQVDEKPIQVKGRVLPPPKLEYHGSSATATLVPRPGVWDMRGKKLCTPAILGSWGIISFVQTRRLSEAQIRTFLEFLVKACYETGLDVRNKSPPIVYASPSGNITEQLRNVWLRTGNFAKAQPQILVCILPAPEAALYAEIKRVLNTELGCASQCLISSKIIDSRGIAQYCGNVCLKLNAKLGGANAFLNPACIRFISSVPTIVFGADVNHPEKGETSIPSFCAVTGSLDARASRYSSACRAQANRHEMIADMEGMVRELLKKFYATSGLKPERILMYRDGLSEGQFQQALDTEVRAIRKACALLDPDYQPKITFVVCQKRHHTRFFPVSPAGGDRSGNLSAGFVVDTGVAHPTEYDFFLLSHAGLQGTSRPTHYRVLIDENNIGPDELQELTYNLCYMYTRCTRSISIVPAIRYADQIAALERHHYNSASRGQSDSRSMSDQERAPDTTTTDSRIKHYAQVQARNLKTSSSSISLTP